MPQSKVAQRLKSLTDEPVVLLSEVLGFYATGTSFLPIGWSGAIGDFLSASPVPETRGLLSKNDDTVPLLRRTFRDRIFVAKNPVYSSLLSVDFGRLYFQPEATNANMGHGDVGIDNFFSEDPERTFYLFPDTFDPGGYYYELAASGVNFQLEKADGTFETAENIYGTIPYSGPGLSEGTSNNNYSATTFLTQIFNGGDDSTTFPNERLPFVQSRFIHGQPLGDGGGFYTSINSDTNPSQGLEILTQINSYPSSANLVGEHTSFPQEFSLLLFDHKRNSHFAITLSSLANSVATIVNTLGSVTGSEAPASVNLSMPVLTTAQLNTFINQTGAAAADLNNDNSVSTADLLEFLTVFGQEGGSTTVEISRAYNSSIQVHGFTYTNDSPFYSLSLDEALNLLNPPSGASVSHGIIDVGDYALNSINQLVSFQQVGDTFEFVPGSWWQSLMSDGLDTFNPSNPIDLRAAHLALALFAYASNGGVPTTLSDFYNGSFFPSLPSFSPFLDDVSLPPLPNFVCRYDIFLRLMEAWHPVLEKPLALEDFPNDEELHLGAPLNYQYESVSVVFNDSPPSGIGQNISTGLPAFQNFSSENKPDYLLFGSGGELEFTQGAPALSNQRIKTFITGYVEISPEQVSSAVFPYLISSGGTTTQNRTLVGFFGTVNTGANANPLIVNGLERHPFSLTIDPASWSAPLNVDTNAFFCADGPDNFATAVRAYPSSWNGQLQGLNAMFCLGAFCFGGEPNRIVITGVSHEVLKTQGEELI